VKCEGVVRWESERTAGLRLLHNIVVVGPSKLFFSGRADIWRGYDE